MSALGRVRSATKIAFWVFRSAITGQYVSKSYAAKHPDTTVRERSRR